MTQEERYIQSILEAVKELQICFSTTEYPEDAYLKSLKELDSDAWSLIDILNDDEYLEEFRNG